MFAPFGYLCIFLSPLNFILEILSVILFAMKFLFDFPINNKVHIRKILSPHYTSSYTRICQFCRKFTVRLFGTEIKSMCKPIFYGVKITSGNY